MKNILAINADTYNYMLLSNMDNGENSVVLDITADVSKNPILEIDGTRVAITSADFEYVIPESLYIGTGVLQFRFVNDDHTGDYFQIAKIASVSGSLFLKRISDLSYSLSCAKSSALDKQAIVDMIYPVGSIYIGVNSTSPETLFGGTWEPVAKGRTLVGVGMNDANTTDYWGTCNANTVSFPAGEMGGEMTHKLTTNEIPRHTHTFSSFVSTIGGNANNKTGTTKSGTDQYMINGGAFNPVGNTGGNGQHNNVQPYLAVYMWKRTA